MPDLFLIARMADRAVAISTDQVRSVTEIGTIVPVPCADRCVYGLTALRSRVVTVICSRRMLGAADSLAAPGRAVITIVEGHHYAILADAVEDVAPFEMRPLPAGIALGGGWRAAGCGIVERDGETILALSLRALIPGLAALAA